MINARQAFRRVAARRQFGRALDRQRHTREQQMAVRLLPFLDISQPCAGSAYEGLLPIL